MRDWVAITCFIIVCILFLISFLSPFIAPHNPYESATINVMNAETPPMWMEGEVPTPIELPSGCVFHKRCPFAFERCFIEVPNLYECGSETFAACHGVEEGKI